MSRVRASHVKLFVLLGSVGTYALLSACSAKDAAKNALDSIRDSGTTSDSATQGTDAATSDSGSSDAGLDSGETAAWAGTPSVVTVSTTGHDRFFGVAYNAQGDIYTVGVVSNGTDSTTDFSTVVAKFNSSGALTTSFGANGFAIKNVAVGTNGEVARGIVVQSTGKIVVSASIEHAGAADARDRDVALVRFNPDGSLDATFGNNGVVTLDLSDGELSGTTYLADNVWGLAAYADDKLLVTASKKRTGGTNTDFAIVRLSPNGALDTSYGTNGIATVAINDQSVNVRTSSILPNGSTLTTGYSSANGIVSPIVFKLNSSGQLDSTFGTNGIFHKPVLSAATEAYGAALQGSSVVTIGYGRNDGGVTDSGAQVNSLDWVSLRFSESGALDSTFGTGGYTLIDVAGFNDNGRAIAALPDNRMLLVGGGRPVADNIDAMIALLTTTGAPDTTIGAKGWKLYDLGGAGDAFWSAAVSPSKTHVAIAGVKGVTADAGLNDDATLLVLSIGK